MSLPDELCPECHGDPRLILVSADRLIRKCYQCGHQYSEEVIRPAVEFVGRGGWVRLKGIR